MTQSPEYGPSNQETPRRPQQTTPPPKDSLREVGLVAAILLGAVVAIGGIWMYQERAEQAAKAARPAVSKRIAREAKTVTAPSPTPRRAPSRPLPVAADAAATAPQPVPSSGDFDVHFEVGQGSLGPKAKALLAERASRMAGHKKIAVLLHGHTDRHGSAASNEALGWKRARAVEAELVRLGLPKTAIQIFSRGENDVLCRTKTESCHRKNRRVHVSWKAMSDLSAAASGAEPSSGPVNGATRAAGADRTGTDAPVQAPVRAAQAASK